jgi:hypothetical protein
VPASKPPPPTAPVKTFAEAIDHVPDNAIAGDATDIAAHGIDQCTGIVAGAGEHIADAAASRDGVNGLARGRDDRIDQMGSGIPEIRNGRGDSVGRTKGAIEPVSTESIAAHAAAENVIQIVDAQAIEQTAGVDDVLQRTAAADWAHRLSYIGHSAGQPIGDITQGQRLYAESAAITGTGQPIGDIA